jgi:hypothetical protein
MFAWIDRVEDDIVEPVVGMVVEQWLEKSLQVGLGINMHRLCAFEHAERCQETYQSKTMISVQMGDEDRIEASGMYPEFLHCQQYAFPAVHEERFVAQLNQLSGGGSCFRRFRTAAA